MELGIGAAVAGWFTTVGVGTVMAGIVGAAVEGAIVGAAIGGLSAAITGGDIGKGILFGAVGGAITGGLTEYFTGGVANQMAGITKAEQAALNEGAISGTSGETAREGLIGEMYSTPATGAPSVAPIASGSKDLTLAQVLQKQGEQQMYGGLVSGVAKGAGDMYSAGKTADTAKETSAMNAANAVTINAANNADALERQKLIGVQQREQQDVNIDEAKRAQDVNVSLQREALLNPAKEAEAERQRRAAGLSSISNTGFLASQIA